VEQTLTIPALVGALVLGLVHLFSGKLRFLEGVPRSRWLSAAGGVSVAYVFVHLLPELEAAQQAVEEGAEGVLPFLEDHVWLIALLGLAIFYGVEKHSLSSRERRRETAGEDSTTGGAFWLSIASFTVYNALIGYLLLRGESEDVQTLVLFTLALAVHFVINDFGLREHHKDAYRRVGRWLLFVAVLAGWLIATLTEISEAALGLVLAFIAGGVVLNVLKEELPGERRARFWAFALGAGGYAALLQLV
jgi:zinc transporter ZupT